MTAPDNGLPKDVVPPGNQTGSYYIPVANLPFGTTWQGFKDFVKPVCSVDHVEIFPKSTSGWFRVNGYQSFMAAFDLFKSKDFMGRAIIADNRNAAMPLKIRDLDISNSARITNRPTSKAAPAPATSASESAPYATGGPVTYPDPTVLESPTTATSSAYGQGGKSLPMSMSPSSYMTSPDTSYTQAIMPSWEALASQSSSYGYGPGSATPSIYGLPAAPDRQPTLYNHPASYAVQPVQPYGEYYAPPATMSLTSQFANLTVGTNPPVSGGGGGGGGIVYTEQRGIHIRDLPRRASEDQVRKMIREAAGREAELINGVDVPLDKDRHPRGWAFVHYRSADLARRMVSELNGLEFKGRKLQARLLKEGETIGGGAAAGSSKGHRSGKHSGRRDEGGRRRMEKDRGERNGASKSSSQPSSSSVKPGPLVVGGSMGLESPSSGSSRDKDKDKSKGKGKEKERHGSSSKCPVVIADGSLGGGRKGDSDRRMS